MFLTVTYELSGFSVKDTDVFLWNGSCYYTHCGKRKLLYWVYTVISISGRCYKWKRESGSKPSWTTRLACSLIGNTATYTSDLSLQLLAPPCIRSGKSINLCSMLIGWLAFWSYWHCAVGAKHRRHTTCMYNVYRTSDILSLTAENHRTCTYAYIETCLAVTVWRMCTCSQLYV